MSMEERHRQIMAVTRHQFGVSDARDAYTSLLIAYQYSNNDAQHMRDLAEICERRAAENIAADVAEDYRQLAAIARWRIAQGGNL